MQPQLITHHLEKKAPQSKHNPVIILSMRVAQISDLHFTHLTFNPFRLFSKRALGHLNWFFRRKKQFFEDQLTPLPKLLEELKVDFVLLGGDFSTTAMKEEFMKAKDWADKVKQPYFAIPGNHDHYTKKSCRNKHFYRYFTNKRMQVEHPVQFFTLKKHRIEAHKLKERWWLIALDTAMATQLRSSEGIFSHKLESYLEEVLQLIPKEDQIIMINHFPFFQNDVKKHNLIRGEELQKILEKHPHIRMYLHGHTHRHIVADLQVSNLPIVLDSGSSAQGRKGAWNLIDIDEKGCKVSTYRWDHRWKNTRVEKFVWTR